MNEELCSQTQQLGDRLQLSDQVISRGIEIVKEAAFGIV